LRRALRDKRPAGNVSVLQFLRNQKTPANLTDVGPIHRSTRGLWKLAREFATFELALRDQKSGMVFL
jgi:hypothetical protein